MTWVEGTTARADAKAGRTVPPEAVSRLLAVVLSPPTRDRSGIALALRLRALGCAGRPFRGSSHVAKLVEKAILPQAVSRRPHPGTGQTLAPAIPGGAGGAEHAGYRLRDHCDQPRRPAE